MPTDIVMPAMGMSQDVGKLVCWRKKQGEEIVKGEPLMDVETDKAVVEVESPASGLIGRLLIQQGDSVPVGEVIGHILAPGEEPAALAVNSVAASRSPVAPAIPSRPAPVATAGPADAASEVASLDRVAASPKARRLAAEKGLDLGSVRGRGPDGAVLAVDLELAATAAVPTPPPSPVDTGSRVWRLMAERTTASWTTAPHFFLTREVDAGRLIAWRSVIKRTGLDVTYSDLLVYLVAEALRQHPAMNSTWREGQGVRHREISVCLAMAVDNGLVAPVIAFSAKPTLASVVQARARLVEKARAGRLQPSDLEGGTFTISNLGMYGVDSFHAVLNGSQAGILAVGRIVDAVVAVEGRIELRPRIALSLSCDHRLVDGARAARFLETLAALVEEPLALFASGGPTSAPSRAEAE
ncbi:MAG TPA: dihydrolipoamide acetyltransferase family protein [Candidatus Acidoferrales bacterium]|nr:dihydrolipoamide acetyltransferase family protein [Candidatus Acidoferrales bacterium]